MQHSDSQQLRKAHNAWGNYPDGWVSRAYTLRRAADVLWKLYADARRELHEIIGTCDVTSKNPGQAGQVSSMSNSQINQDLTLDDVARMLMGMSLEALVKGFLAAQDQKLIEDGKLQGEFRSHDLEALIKKADIVLSSDELLQTAKSFTPFIKWAGRYPIPTKSQDLRPRMVVGRGEMTKAPRGSAMRSFLASSPSSSQILVGKLIEESPTETQ